MLAWSAGESFCFAECVSKGETCQKSGGFHQFGRCAREGREGGT